MSANQKNINMEPIAIVGASCRFPGQVVDLDSFWKVLSNGVDAITSIPPDRFSTERFCSASKSIKGRSYVSAAGIVNNLKCFDAEFFGMSKTEAESQDPQQRMALELAWEALEQAHISPSSIRGTKTGVFIGASLQEIMLIGANDVGKMSPYSIAGSCLSIISNRVSHFFDLHGPSMVIDTACSSSLVAVHEACKELRAGKIPLALAGGTHTILAPFAFIGFSRAHMLSPDGRCKPFDAAGNGYVRGEGAGMLVLKTLTAAQKDGDDILGLIVASNINSDGHTIGLAMPNVKAQTALLEDTYNEFKLDKNRLVYFEAHGTGTAVGDPVEASAIGNILGQSLKGVRTLLVGSVKSNIGHLEPASGIAGLIKSLLIFKHGKIPKTLHFTTPNPEIDFQGLNIAVPEKLSPLPDAGGGELISINSFGFGGTNAHVVLQKPEKKRSRKVSADRGKPLPPLFLSAGSAASLIAMAKTFAERLKRATPAVYYDTAATLALHRETLPHRLVISGVTLDEICSQAKNFGRKDAAKPGANFLNITDENASGVFVYTGNGSQWPGMGKDLLEKNQDFRKAIEEIDSLFAPLQSWSILEFLRNADKYKTEYEHAEKNQPLLFAIQVALTKALAAKGLMPSAVVGHSVGEIAAAWAAGALTLQDAVRVIYFRSILQEPLQGAGAMAAVNISESTAREMLKSYDGKIEIAAFNTRASLSLSGDRGALQAFAKECRQKRIAAKVLDIPYPYHTAAMDAIRDNIFSALKELAPKRPKIPFYSCVTGNILRKAPDADYWFKNLRFPVLFTGTVEEIIKKGYCRFLEVGPSVLLCNYIRDIARQQKKNVAILKTLTKSSDSAAEFETSWKEAWQAGWELDRNKIFHLPFIKQELPAYPWNREWLWPVDTTEQSGVINQKREHPLLGWPLSGTNSMFLNTVLPADFPWLSDHVVGKSIIYPAAAFLESMLAAAHALYPDEQLSLERVNIFRPLSLSDSAPKVIRLSVDVEDGGIMVEARNHMRDEPWEAYARARIVRESSARVPSGISSGRPNSSESPSASNLLLTKPETFGELIDKETFYSITKRFSLHYGKAFRTVEKLWVNSSGKTPEALVELGMTELGMAEGVEGMLTPPALMDGALQSMIVFMNGMQSKNKATYLPVAFDRVVLHEAGIPHFAHIRLERVSPRSTVAGISYMDARGKLILELRGARFRCASWLDYENTPSKPYVVTLIAQEHPAKRTALTGVSLAELAAGTGGVIQKALQDEKRKPHPDALLQLGVLSFAHELLLSLCPKGSSNLSLSALQDAGLLSKHQTAYLEALLSILKSEKLACSDGTTWTIQAQSGRIVAGTLWRTLVANAPDYLQEAALLTHVAGSFKTIIGEAQADNEKPIISPAYIKKYFTDSASIKPCLEAAQASLQAVLTKAGSEDNIKNVLLLAPEPDAILPYLMPLLAGKNCRLVVAEKDEASLQADSLRFSSPALNLKLLNPLVPQNEDFGRYHFILLPWSLRLNQNSVGLLDSCHSMLAPGGILCQFEHNPSLFTDFVFGSLPALLFQDSAYWRNCFGQTDFKHIKLIEASVNAPGMIIFAQKALEATTANIQNENEKSSLFYLLVAGKKDSPSFSLSQALLGLLQKSAQAATLICAEDKNLADSKWWRQIFAGIKKEAQGKPVQLVFTAGYDSRTELSSKILGDIELRGTSALNALAKAWDASGKDCRLCVVSGGAIPGAVGARLVPSQGPLAGFLRVMKNEMRTLNAQLVDLQADVTTLSALLPEFLLEIQTRTEEPEVVLSSVGRQVPRMERLILPDDSEETAAVLAFDQPGSLQNLYWKKTALPTLAEDEVCIAVKNVGLNFRDVMFATGMLQDEALENGFTGPSMGLEHSGVVKSVGSKVTCLKPGDAVLGMCPASFGTLARTRATTLALKPDNISFAAASTIPVAFLTAWYSLKHLARLKTGEKLLIHGAVGGVGLAAIQIAAHLGLEVYATVGSPEKRNFLRQLGLIKNIYSSRGLTFAEEILADTKGIGVDAVLNSLSGEAIAAGISVLKPFGRFLELGKRDFYADSPLRLRPFSNNITYFGIDVDQLMVYQSVLAEELFAEVMELFAERKLVPLPYTEYTAARCVDAFFAMQRSAHIGKLTVSMQGADETARPREKKATRIALPEQATYLVTGGTGGLGLASARRLSERGAKYLILLSRSGVKDEQSLKIIKDMRTRGVQALIVKADISDADALCAALQEPLASLPPLKGIIHAAVALDDGLIMNLTSERIKRALAAKTLGAWNLHNLTRKLPLDFFVMYSSAVTSFGNPGQASYVAANSMLETLAAYRREEGLAAQVIGFGAISDVGMLTRNPAVMAMLQKNLGISPTSADDALEHLETCIAQDIGSSFFFGFNWNSRSNLSFSSRFALLRPAGTNTDETQEVSAERIRMLGPLEGLRLIEKTVIKDLSRILRLPVETITLNAPLVSYGMDSLMVMELGMAIEQTFGLSGYTPSFTAKVTVNDVAQSLLAVFFGQQDEEGKKDDLVQQIAEKHGVRLSDSERAYLQQSQA